MAYAACQFRGPSGLTWRSLAPSLYVSVCVSVCLCVSLCVSVAAVVAVHATVASDPHEHIDRSVDPTAASQLEVLLAMYRSEMGLYQNVSTDLRGFDAAVRRRGGYMGPWM